MVNSLVENPRAWWFETHKTVGIDTPQWVVVRFIVKVVETCRMRMSDI